MSNWEEIAAAWERATGKTIGAPASNWLTEEQMREVRSRALEMRPPLYGTITLPKANSQPDVARPRESGAERDLKRLGYAVDYVNGEWVMPMQYVSPQPPSPEPAIPLEHRYATFRATVERVVAEEAPRARVVTDMVKAMSNFDADAFVAWLEFPKPASRSEFTRRQTHEMKPSDEDELRRICRFAAEQCGRAALGGGR